jgi:hypothetical protein
MVDSFFDALPEYLELIMGFAPYLLMVAIPIAVFIAYRKTQNETKKAKETANLLGLSYINVAEEMKDSKPQDSFLLGLLSSWSTWAMEGTYNGVPVRAEQIVKAKQQRYNPNSSSVSVSNPTRTSYSKGTKYTASFKKPLPFDVVIRQHVRMNMPFGFPQPRADDSIGTGDEELDKLVFVSGSDKNSIHEWLNASQRKDALKNLYQALPSVNVNNDGLHFHDLHSKADYERLQNNLRALSEAALRLKID